MLTPETTFTAALLSLLVAIIGTAAPKAFVEALSRLRFGPAKGRAVVLLWLKRMKIPLRHREDAAQDTLEAAFRSWDRFDDQQLRRDPTRQHRPLFAAWLYAICMHMAGHWRERAHVRREVLAADPLPLEVTDAAPFAPDLLASTERREVLTAALARLALEDPVAARVLIAHDIDEIPMTEIIEETGLPPSTVYKVRARAIDELRVRRR